MTAPGRRLALLIGVERYESDAYADLPSAGVDVRQLSKVLDDPRIGHFDDVDILGPAPTADAMRLRIGDFLAKCEPADLVVLYISGHGQRTTRTDGQLHFIATSTDATRLAETAVPASFINEQFEWCRAQKKVAIFDCCVSGGFALGFRTRDAKSAGPPARDVLDATGVYVLSSSQLSEQSFSGKSAKDPLAFHRRAHRWAAHRRGRRRP